jgi:hypothetical protein
MARVVPEPQSAHVTRHGGVPRAIEQLETFPSAAEATPVIRRFSPSRTGSAQQDCRAILQVRTIPAGRGPRAVDSVDTHHRWR